MMMSLIYTNHLKGASFDGKQYESLEVQFS